MTSASADKHSDGITTTVTHPRLVTAALMAVAIAQVIDITIANVALPHMQSSLNTTLDKISWVLTGFIIAIVMLTPSIGWLTEKLGARRLFLIGVGGFTVSSMLCGAAQSLTEMVLFRVLQGMSAAIVGPMSQTLLLNITATKDHAKVMSLWGSVIMIAPILGPTLGGILTDSLSWRWVFLINLPICIPAFIVLYWQLPKTPPNHKAKLDIAGLITLACALGTFQLMLDRGQHLDWFGSYEIIAELVLSLSFLWIFVVHTLHTEHPLFPRELFKTQYFFSTSLMMFILGAINVGMSSILPIMFQNIYDYNVTTTGVLMIPRGIGMMITMTLAGRLISLFDMRYIISLGFLLSGVATWEMSNWALEINQSEILWTGFLQGLGLGLVFMPINYLAISPLTAHLRQYGPAMMNLLRNFGSSMGISIIFALLARNTQSSHADLSAHITEYSFNGFELSILSERLGDYGATLMHAVNGYITREAAMISYINNFYALSFVIFGVALIPLLLKAPPR